MALFHCDLLPPALHTASPAQIGVLRTIAFAVGLTVGLVTAVDAQSGADSQRHHASADKIDRRLGELYVAPSAPQ